VIQPFDAHSAEGQEILWRLSDGVYQHEFYVMHFPPLDSNPSTSSSSSSESPTRSWRLLCSNRHLFCLSGLTPLTMSVAWKCSLLSVAAIRRTRSEGLVIDLKVEDQGVARCFF